MDYKKAKDLKDTMSFDFIYKNDGSPLNYANKGVGTELSNSINGITVIKEGDNFSIKIYVEHENVDSYRVSKYLGINETDLVVHNIGNIRIQGMMAGYCLGHQDVSGGTLGCFVKNNLGEKFVLSNNHVLANANKGKKGDAILHPCRRNGGIVPEDIIATLHDFVPIKFDQSFNYIDCGIAKILNEVDVIHTEIPVIGKVEGVMRHDFDMPVAKYGQQSNLTVGKIISIDSTIKVDYGGKFLTRKVAVFNNQIEIKSTVPGTRFSQIGDSGSMIVNLPLKKVVGLVFAGTASGITFANPIEAILKAFEVEII